MTPSQVRFEEPAINANPTQLREPAAATPPKGGVWRTIRGFILWSHERGTVQYDVMVTLILLFVFFSARWIKYNDTPVERNPHATGVFVYPDKEGLVYEVNAAAVRPEVDVKSQLLRVIEPIAGETSILKYEAVADKKGKVQSYKVWVNRQ